MPENTFSPHYAGISIVVRTLNERGSAAALFSSLRAQRYPGEIQIIVVDNQSDDGTDELALRYGFDLVCLPRDQFSYPRSMNAGIDRALHEIVILTVGHALPLSENWITAAARHFKADDIAGVYSPVLPHKQHSLAETLLYYPGYFMSKVKSPYEVKEVGSGVFGATNIALRRSLWHQHHFDERYGLGGEDTEWAKWALLNGKRIICDTDFCVRHSHHLGLIGVMKQVAYWNRLSQHTEFSYKALRFRRDLKIRKQEKIKV